MLGFKKFLSLTHFLMRNFQEDIPVRGSTLTGNLPPWPGIVVTICMSCILQQEVLVRNMELTSHHQLEEFGKGQKETPHV